VCTPTYSISSYCPLLIGESFYRTHRCKFHLKKTEMESAPSSRTSSLIIRVKRPRDQPGPSEVLVLHDDVSSLAEGAKRKKKLVERPSSAGLQVCLQKIDTLDMTFAGDNKSAARLDAITLNCFKRKLDGNISESIEEHEYITSGNEGTWVTEHKKKVRFDEENSVVIVDIEVVPAGPRKAAKEISAPYIEAAAPATKILDPANRSMEQSIEKAFQTADLSGIFRALELGASVNTQTRSHGLTALMVAAYHGDTRVVSRLI
jgi:hypothetical protein